MDIWEEEEEDQEDVAMRPRAPRRGGAGVLEHGVPCWGAGGEQRAPWGSGKELEEEGKVDGEKRDNGS